MAIKPDSQTLGMSVWYTVVNSEKYGGWNYEVTPLKITSQNFPPLLGVSFAVHFCTLFLASECECSVEKCPNSTLFISFFSTSYVESDMIRGFDTAKGWIAWVNVNNCYIRGHYKLRWPNFAHYWPPFDMLIYCYKVKSLYTVEISSTTYLPTYLPTYLNLSP